ncbi:MAG: aromatic ring-hydroxylating dioxygenase subunit alpha [Gammaproteobacteria bacterium]|nr:aromatic ring-hydroxylating dioxygenase subunit alpha [Gammaproteobacteria bacterium]
MTVNPKLSNLLLDGNVRRQLSAVKIPVGTAATLPPQCYTNDDIFKWEQEELFGRSWIGIGRVDRWKERGDYSAIDIAGVPIIVLRDREGDLHAFSNSCRHRGAKLLQGDGNCDTVRCPFHRWTYALDGRLLLGPSMDKTPDFDKLEYGLIPVRLETKFGFAFVCFDESAPGLDQWLGDFEKLHAPWVLHDLHTTRRLEFEAACNWKIFIEVFNEYYHLPYVHPKTLDHYYDTPQDTDEVTGQYTTQFGTTQGSAGVLENAQDQALPIMNRLQGRERNGIRYTWLFPNLTFAASNDCIWAYDVNPLAPDLTRVGMSVCFPEENIAREDFEQRVQSYYTRLDESLQEDISALINQQAGLNSPLAQQGRFCYLEPSVANFACWYAEKLLAQ